MYGRRVVRWIDGNKIINLSKFSILRIRRIQIDLQNQ